MVRKVRNKCKKNDPSTKRYYRLSLCESALLDHRDQYVWHAHREAMGVVLLHIETPERVKEERNRCRVKHGHGNAEVDESTPIFGSAIWTFCQ